jgi:Tfp pilus assembly protein PilF
MQKNRDDRYQDASTFRAALDEVLSRELGPTGVAASSVRTRILQIGLPVGTVIVLAVVAFIVFGRGGSPKPNRDVAKSHNELGQSAAARGDTATAEDEYHRAIIADESYSVAWINLGVLAWAEGNFADADSCFRGAIAADSASAMAMYNLATLRWERGDTASAERFYLASLRADSTFVPSFNNLSALLVDLRRYDEARDWLDRGLALEPNQPYLLKNRGIVATRVGDDSGAIAYWEEAIAADSTITELHRLSAEWYERHGRPTDARKEWEIVARSSNSENQRLAQQALKRLRSP